MVFITGKYDDDDDDDDDGDDDDDDLLGMSTELIVGLHNLKEIFMLSPPPSTQLK